MTLVDTIGYKNLVGYFYWFLICLFVLLFFSFGTKKGYKSWKLFFFVLMLSWVSVTILKVLEYSFIEHIDSVMGYKLYSFQGFTMVMAEMSAHVLLIGGITFCIKYSKFKKKKKKKKEKNENT